MTPFQVLALVFFVAAVAVTKLWPIVGKYVRGVVNQPGQAKSIAVTLVDELVSVTELRDKLASESCPEGVEACTTLLRVIVEHKQPTQGAV